MEVTTLGPFSEVLILRPKIFGDDRGFFVESYNANTFKQATGLSPNFVQDNHSRSSRGVLRGIHYQLPPHAQGKLVRVVKGAVWDVAVDLRKSSPTFGQWAGYELRDHRGEMLWIPPGFGHAFLVLENDTDFLYKTTDFYAPECERAVIWDDQTVDIQWPGQFKRYDLLISEKDKKAPRLRETLLFE